MTNKEALETVIGIASAWAENAEEDFVRRLKASDSDEDLQALINADPNSRHDLEYLQEVRDAWRAIEKLLPLTQMEPR